MYAAGDSHPKNEFHRNERQSLVWYGGIFRDIWFILVFTMPEGGPDIKSYQNALISSTELF